MRTSLNGQVGGFVFIVSSLMGSTNRAAITRYHQAHIANPIILLKFFKGCVGGVIFVELRFSGSIHIFLQKLSRFSCTLCVFYRKYCETWRVFPMVRSDFCFPGNLPGLVMLPSAPQRSAARPNPDLLFRSPAAGPDG